MVAKLSTTIKIIEKLSNSSNRNIINEFLIYMKNNGSSERHQNNILMRPLLKLSVYWFNISASLSISSPSTFNFDIISSHSEDCEVKVKRYLVQVGILESSKKRNRSRFYSKIRKIEKKKKNSTFLGQLAILTTFLNPYGVPRLTVFY